jgi:D-aspartate ligase
MDEPLMNQTPAVAVVMNMFYTGLGIARSLGERGIPVIGLSAQRGIFGNYTRYADVRFCPDSREKPEDLIKYLVKLGEQIGRKSVIFPTRDDDVLFLDRFRSQLSRHFIPVIASSDALGACLDKWETFVAATKVGVPVPRSWKIETQHDLSQIIGDVSFPAVLKPLSAHYWRKEGNWERVGAQKAIRVSSPAELREEYERIARVDGRLLLQEMVPGGDDRLLIAACYLDQASRLVAGFTVQKLAQVPEGFGTGCILQTVDRPELLDLAVRVLEAMRYTGIAEVEFKRDPSSGEYKLIEINPRPWDQHRLGHACGVDVIHAAYCYLTGRSIPQVQWRKSECKWVAEDVLFLAALRSLWRRDGKARSLRRLAKGKRIYAIWSVSDPLPSIAYLPWCCIGSVAGAVFSRLSSALGRRVPDKRVLEKKSVL